MAIGNAAWPIGVTMVGIHARTGREKIFARNVAHVLNDETQRKYIQACCCLLLVTYCSSSYSVFIKLIFFMYTKSTPSQNSTDLWSELAPNRFIQIYREIIYTMTSEEQWRRSWVGEGAIVPPPNKKFRGESVFLPPQCFSISVVTYTL